MTEERAVVLMQQIHGSEELKMSVRNINDMLQYFIEQYTLKMIKTLFDLCSLGLEERFCNVYLVWF